MAPRNYTMKSVEGAAASKNTLMYTYFKRKAKGRRPLKHGLATDDIAIVGGPPKTKKKRGPVAQVLTPKKPKTMMILPCRSIVKP
jgi:hypothetical protein